LSPYLSPTVSCGNFVLLPRNINVDSPFSKNCPIPLWFISNNWVSLNLPSWEPTHSHVHMPWIQETWPSLLFLLPCLAIVPSLSSMSYFNFLTKHTYRHVLTLFYVIP
jgi:hypothetical protein